MEKEYYPRAIDNYLLEWKQDKHHKPLLLRGARQVGKSSAIRRLGKHFTHFLEVNFERDKSVHNLFTDNLQPKEIAARLAIIYDTPVIPGETLLFFDEIQACPEAIHSLWFFYEDYQELHVAAVGSLLEFALKKLSSFGVGRVRSLFMYPMSFDEFLIASGKQSWFDAKKQASPNSPLFNELHDKLMNLFRSYLIVGGMPESVSSWLESGDYKASQQILDDIMVTYEADFSKYEAKIEPMLLRHVLHSVAEQIGRKFTYSNVIGNNRAEKVKDALELLRDAGLIIPVVHTAANGLPLGAQTNDKFIKYLFLDSGLLLRQMGLEQPNGAAQILGEILTCDAADLVNKGNVTEMVAGLELLKYQTPTLRHDLYYWQNLSRGSQAEVDYVLANSGAVTPLEIKAGTAGKMKSLYQFLSDRKLPMGIRSSLENFGQLEKVKIIPLYAVSNLINA
jgi:predicted AAA+ superfamily ATPase